MSKFDTQVCARAYMEIGEHPGASITMMKSVSGIKSVRSIETYMGTSKRAQKQALDYLANRK